MTTQRPTILVGCDGSAESVKALTWAADYARDADGSLHLVATWDWPTFQDAPITYGRWDPDEYSREQLVRLRRTLDLPDERIEVDVVHGHASRVLVEYARNADMLVVGTHGLGAVSRLVLGSVSAHCASHAPVPVAVVRTPQEQRRGILLGIDDSENSGVALRWAMDYADLVHQPLTVVHVTEPPPPAIPSAYPMRFSYPLAAVHGQIRLWLRDLVDKEEAERGRAVAAGVSVHVRDGNPAHLLVEESARASLTVCGRRGAGGFRRLLLGSVASALAHHGQSTIVIVPSA